MSLGSRHSEVKLQIKSLSDLKLNLQDILDRDLDFQGSFAHQQTYEDPPNPYLSIKGLGYIGLPLSLRDAEAIISKCSQAPFGKGAKTIVDTAVRDTWQLDPRKVSFDHPKWRAFVNGLVRDACKGLGVNLDVIEPDYKLHSLLMYKSGSHFESHQDTEKTPGMFATMVVILPSKFTGGDVHLGHAGSSKVFKCSEDSLFNISALSWYTDVFHEVKPIKKGYRLALSYNLIRRSTIPKPILPSSDVTAKKLELAFQIWAAGKVVSTKKLVYLLDHEYSMSGLEASILKGTDAVKVKLLSEIGAPLGFRFGFAKVEYFVAGVLKDPYDGLDLVSIYTEEMKFGALLDLEGQPVVTFEPGDYTRRDFIHEDLSQRIAKGDVDNYDKEDYLGNDGGTADLWYYRTVLVIWHKSSEDSDSGNHSDDSETARKSKKRKITRKK